MKKNYFFLFATGIFCLHSHAQSLDKIGKKDMATAGGGLSYSSVFYDANGIPDRRQPFTWFLNGNLTATLLDISLPFTFNYSNNQVAYTQPYMLQSFNPTWKWVKGYAGVTSMNFSSYTLAGHVFSGGGIELTPKNFKISAMYGRLKKAVEFDAENNSDAIMSYKRMGGGFSAGYEKKGHGIKLIFFSAKDDPASLSFVPPNTSITPMQNTVVSLSVKTIIYKKLKLETEYALSGLTRSLNTSEEITGSPTNKLPLLFKPNPTSAFYDAFKTSFGYNQKSWALNLIYERIAPGYTTLGGYFFNNDFENITLSPALSLLKGKLKMSCNTGMQQNNLDGSKLNTNRRWVGSLNATYAPNKHWNFNSSYSNFRMYTKQRPQTDPFYQNTLDTLNFYQLSQNAMFSGGYNFGKEKMKQNIILTMNYLVTAQDQGNVQEPGLFSVQGSSAVPLKVLNGNIGHSLQFVKSKMNITTSLNGNYSQLPGAETIYAGPNINIGKSFSKNKIRAAAGSSFNAVLINSVKTNELFNHRISFNYAPKLKSEKAGKVSIMTSISYIQKLRSTSASTGFTEFTGNFGINYSF